MARKRRKKKGQATELDPARWAHAAFAVAGFMVAWVMTNAAEAGWAMLFSYVPSVGRPVVHYANAAGVAVALIGTVWAWRVKRYFSFMCEVVVEVSQVAWPTRAETRAATGVVIAITLVCSAILAVMDTIWSFATNWLYGI